MDLYDNSTKRIRSILEEEERSGVIQPSICLSHGKPTEWSVLCYHGFTKSPHQFIDLAQRLFRLGANVWIPRLPHHGLSSEKKTEVAQLTPAELKSFVARHVDLIKPLGEKPVVMGLSGGGVLAAWAAARYPGLFKTLCISPVLGIRTFPRQLHSIVPDLIRWMPNRFIDWEEDDSHLFVDGEYPEFSTRALSAFLELGVEVYKNRRQGLVSKKMIMIMNANDDKVDNEIAARILEGWGRKGQNEIERIDFAASENLPHDIISIDSLADNADRLYKMYEELIFKI